MLNYLQFSSKYINKYITEEKRLVLLLLFNHAPKRKEKKNEPKNLKEQETFSNQQIEIKTRNTNRKTIL